MVARVDNTDLPSGGVHGVRLRRDVELSKVVPLLSPRGHLPIVPLFA